MENKELSNSQSIPLTADLHKTVSLWNGMSIVLSTMIGVGIFMSPQTIIFSAPSVYLSLSIWFICGVIAICAALTYVELGLMFPESGGEYVYLYKSLPRYVSFSYIWCSILVLKPTSVAILMQFFAETIVKLFFLDCVSFPSDAARYLASAVVLLMTALNIYRFKWSLAINNFLTFTKFFALGSMILFGIIHLIRGKFENIYLKTEITKISVSSLGSAFYNGMWAFDGWNQLNYMSGEMKTPEKDLPLALIISTSVITIIYVLVNFSYIVLMGMPNILESTGVAYDAGTLYLGKYAVIVSIFVALSAFGAGNATLFCGGRIFYKAARNKQLPWIVSTLHKKHRTMFPSIIIQSALTIFYLLFVGNIEIYLIYFSGAVWFYYLMAFVSTIVLRYTMPNHPRPFKVNIMIPIFMCFVSVAILILGFLNYVTESFISVAGVFSSLVPYYLFVNKGSLLPHNINLKIDLYCEKLATFADLYYPQSDEDIIG